MTTVGTPSLNYCLEWIVCIIREIVTVKVHQPTMTNRYMRVPLQLCCITGHFSTEDNYLISQKIGISAVQLFEFYGLERNYHVNIQAYLLFDTKKRHLEVQSFPQL